MRTVSIRWRLTVLYTGILIAILIILGSLVYVLLHFSLMSQMERELQTKADEVLKSTKVVSTLPFFLRQIVLPDVEVFAAPDIYLQIVIKSGEIVARSQNLGSYSLPIDPKIFRSVLQGNSIFHTFNIDNEEFRVLVKPVRVDEEIVGILQVARPLKGVDLAMRRLQTILLVGGLLSLLLSLVLGRFMSGRALAPIKHLTAEAKSIGKERDFQRRVRYSGPPDELNELAVTFNQMLAGLEEAYQQLTDSLSLQQRFVADASHELRTPLTSIQGNVDFLLQLDQKDPKLQKEVLLDISAETQRLSRLVKELLTLAKADSGLKLNLTELKIAPVLEEVVRQARFLEKGQNFILSLEAAEGVVLRVDPDYFKQMLYIFLDNGFKYTPPGQSFSFQVKREGEELGLIFQDEGPGIPEKDLPHIFERFYRSEASRTGEGAGLGLAIAKWIIEQHGGKIKVESEENKGTTFFITFPMHQQK